MTIGPDGALDPRGLRRGPSVYSSPDAHAAARTRFDERLRVAELGDDHLWTAIAHYIVTDPEAEPLIMDTENLAGVYVGCYRCEEPYEPRLKRRRCAGTVPPPRR